MREPGYSFDCLELECSVGLFEAELESFCDLGLIIDYCYLSMIFELILSQILTTLDLLLAFICN